MKNFYTLSLLIPSLLSGYQKPANNFKQDKIFAAVTTYKIPDEVALIYRSIDAGNTWSPFSNEIPLQATISSLVSRGSKIFAYFYVSDTLGNAPMVSKCLTGHNVWVCSR